MIYGYVGIFTFLLVDLIVFSAVLTKRRVVSQQKTLSNSLVGNKRWVAPGIR
jgi:hypothetical protein